MLLRLFLISESITIYLNKYKNLNWNVKEILWMYWIIYSLLLGFNIVVLLYFFNKLCRFLFEGGKLYDCNYLKNIVNLISLNFTSFNISNYISNNFITKKKKLLKPSFKI